MTPHYEAMPEERPHGCYAVNAAGIPVHWIVYEPNHGYELFSTDAYGDGSIVNITFCPWCGSRLMTTEQELRLNWAGRKNRAGIRSAIPS